MQPDVTITTPTSGAVVVIKGYLTGRAKLAIKAARDRSMTFVPVDGQETPRAEVSGAIMGNMNMEALHNLVVSIQMPGGERIVDKSQATEMVLDLPSEDTDAVVDAINIVTKDKLTDEKKSNSTSNSSVVTPVSPVKTT